MIKKTVLAALALIAFLAAGCTPTMQELSATCTEYGFAPDTTAFLECRQREMHAFEAKQNSINNAAMGFWM